MANEIYDSTWWGNTRQTASSIGTSTEMIQGQFNLTKIGDEEVTNGDFATDSDWIKLTGWSISGGKANCDGTINQSLLQTNVFTIGKSYKINFTISDVVGSLYARIWMATGGARIEANANGNYTTYWEADGTDLYTTTLSTNTATYSITNISVQEVRATTVEASKCLADAIHRIGIQDIQN